MLERINKSKSYLFVAALCLCLAGALLRAVPLLLHEPLIALANSYDEVRYTACFDLYPDRPDAGDPTRNSPEAPYSHYAFAANPAPMCYWSTELLFQAATAGVYHLQHWLSGTKSFSVRWIGAFKFATLLALWLAFSVAFMRRGEPWSALANGLLLPLVFADPADTIYLNTFYAEWTALLALYAVIGLILLHEDQAYSRAAFVLIALAASALALSKIQHLLLPLICAATVLLANRLRAPRWSWQGGALLLGALAGLAVQVVQLRRDSPAIEAINHFNRADVTFTALLPHARDAAATAQQLGLAPDCLQYIGKSAWQISAWPDVECPQLANVTRTRELATLAREPDLFLRLWWHGLSSLEPWLAPGLGTVEGDDFAPLPTKFFSLSRVLSAMPAWRLPPLAGPFVVCLWLLWRGRWRALPRLFLLSALTCMVMLATLTITVLGDGLADVPKQGHLIPNIALAWWICILVAAFGRYAPRVQSLSMPSISTSSSARQISPRSTNSGVSAPSRATNASRTRVASAAWRT